MGYRLWIIGLFAVVSALTFTSCSESSDEEEEYADWQNKNETYFNTVAQTARTAIAQGDNTWKSFLTYTKVDSAKATIADSIFVKVIEEGKGAGCPVYTDSVKVHYCGRLIPSKSYAEGFVFDKTYSGNVFDAKVSYPEKFTVNGVVIGFATALMHMHIGDHWMVYIPSNLAYGSAAQTNIPAYSTLVYEMQLDSYFRVGTQTRN
ncbi:MAG: FKBP-type peptidyl-prolyl cis-trans isomerase [Prevotellaceae bacterium]|nr:FKBP-type peptidyl-prolyl cis-trans isomerase [Prevotellaceae bacterium]